MNDTPLGSTHSSHTRKGLKWLSDHWPYLVQIAGQVGLAFMVVLVGARDDLSTDPRGWIVSWSGAVLVACAVAWIFGFVVTILQSDSVSKLRSRVTSLQVELETVRDQRNAAVSDYFSMIASCLRLISNKLLSFGDTERISVYQHDGSAFVMLGRYSKNPEYNKRGRMIYADDQGCIGRAWLHGSAVVSALPDPKSSLGAYVEANTELGMPPETTRELAMKSRCIAAFAIEDARGDRIAVIVFESTEPEKLDFELLESKVRSESEGQFLASMIEVMQPHEPSPSLASRKGF